MTPLQKLLASHRGERDGRPCYAFPDGSHLRPTTQDETPNFFYVAAAPDGVALRSFGGGTYFFPTVEAAVVALALAGFGPLEVRTVR